MYGASACGLRAYNVLDQICHPQGAETAKGQPSDGGVLVLAVLVQKVDGQQGQIGIGLCVGTDEQVQHLFEDDVFGVRHARCHDLHE